ASARNATFPRLLLREGNRTQSSTGAGDGLPQQRPRRTSMVRRSARIIIPSERTEAKENMTELAETAKALVAEGKGILAADESGGTIKKRFDTIGVESTEENRRAYRNMLFTTPGVEEYISGVILFDETIRQQADDGTPFPDLL